MYVYPHTLPAMSESNPAPLQLWQTIPPSFWHVLSFAVILMTVTVAYKTLRSTSVEFQILDMRLGLSQVVDETQQISSELRANAEALEEDRAELRQGIEELEQTVGNLPAAQEVIRSLAPLAEPDTAAVSAERFERLDEYIGGLRGQIQAPLQAAPLSELDIQQRRRGQ